MPKKVKKAKQVKAKTIKPAKMKNLRVRFAPSPTGYLHIGGLRTAFYDYLLAKKNNGKFILRIEDTDQARSVPGGVEAIIRALTRAGLNYDEGPFLKNTGIRENKNKKAVGRTKTHPTPPLLKGGDGQVVEKGKYGPYIQSKRLKIYKKYVDELLKKDKAYYCFCTAERLDQMRQEQTAKKLPTMYDGRCRDLKKDEVKKLLQKKTPYVIRMKIPRDGTTGFKDLIRGDVFFENRLVDDQVLMKSDGFPTYHIANVVDDHLMKITCVIRGEEWLSSTPKHLLLYESFGWKAPLFAHMPLLLNPDKSKLSKRQGDVAVEDYLNKGYLPEAILNFLALLGWAPEGEREIFSLKELIKKFDISELGKSGSVFNLEKLDWLNGFYIRNKSLKDFAKLCIPYLLEAKLIKQIKTGFVVEDTGETVKKDWLEKVLKLEQERVKHLSEIPYFTEFFFKNKLDYDTELLLWHKTRELPPEKRKSEAVFRLNRMIKFFEGLAEKDFEEKTLEKKIIEIIGSEDLGTGDTLWPFRVALSGRQASPGPFELAAVLGKEKIVKRLHAAIEKLS
jgi:glutamyl-tRNA synthetase